MNRVLKSFIVFILFFTMTGCTGHLVHIKGERLDNSFDGIKPGATFM